MLLFQIPLKILLFGGLNGALDYGWCDLNIKINYEIQIGFDQNDLFSAGDYSTTIPACQELDMFLSLNWPMFMFTWLVSWNLLPPSWQNFVGLSVADGYIACGSETNEVYNPFTLLEISSNFSWYPPFLPPH